MSVAPIVLLTLALGLISSQARIPAQAGSEEAPRSWEARFPGDNLGLEIERHLPGGVRSMWQRDKLGRPLSHEIWSGRKQVAAKSYTWETNDRLKRIVDALHGPITFAHDNLGNLTAAVDAKGKMDLRMPDAVGNLFKTRERQDRKYGPAGQLLESLSKAGITRYTYDPEGNLILKSLPDGSQWKYECDAAGMLARVVRPDGKTVEFGYDALGRRVWKKYQGKTTKWVWDGNVPVHEWVEVEGGVAEPAPETVSEAEDAGLRQRAVDLAKRSSQGPPLSGPLAPRSGERARVRGGGTASSPITWVFDPESFAPAARLAGDEQHAIITDHLGTPTAMLDGAGQTVWSADIGIWGELRNVVGEKGACPFRWPGQYEDEETGLYYNRFRYYDPESGEYVSQDPIGLAGGLRSYAYVRNPSTWFDNLGLSCVPSSKNLTPISRKNARRLLESRGLSPRQAREITDSFQGQIHVSQGKAGDVFVITESRPGSASGAFVTRDFAGNTPSDRVGNLALPPSNTAESEALVELTRPQTLLEGRVAPQPSWGPDRTGGGWQVVTDGGRYTGAVNRIT